MTWMLLVFYVTWREPEMRRFDLPSLEACEWAEQIAKDQGQKAMCLPLQAS